MKKIKSPLLNTILNRTAEGVSAFTTAALKPHPGRLGYLAASAVSVVAAATRSDHITRVVKPSLMPLLATEIVLPDATPSNPAGLLKPVVPNPDQAILLAGLVGGWLGDITLMGKDSRSEDPDVRAANLNKGAFFFSFNQLANIWLLARRGAQPSKLAVQLRAPALISGAVLSAVRLPKALPAAVGYGSLLAATSTLGDDRSIIRGSVKDNPEDYGISHGGNLFVLSDALLLARFTLLKKSHLPGASAISQTIDALTDGAVMATYTIAQLLLVDGLNRK